MFKGSSMYKNKARKSKISKVLQLKTTTHFSYLLFFIFWMMQCSGNFVAVMALLTA